MTYRATGYVLFNASPSNQNNSLAHLIVLSFVIQNLRYQSLARPSRLVDNKVSAPHTPAPHAVPGRHALHSRHLHAVQVGLWGLASRISMMMMTIFAGRRKIKVLDSACAEKLGWLARLGLRMDPSDVWEVATRRKDF